jgi:hypothetical protein
LLTPSGEAAWAAIPGVVDGKVHSESIGAALAAGRFADVPILGGINHDEDRGLQTRDAEMELAKLLADLGDEGDDHPRPAATEGSWDARRSNKPTECAARAWRRGPPQGGSQRSFVVGLTGEDCVRHSPCG